MELAPAIHILMLPDQCMVACIRWGDDEMMVRHMRNTGEIFGTYRRPLKGRLSEMKPGEACYTHAGTDMMLKQTASLATMASVMLADQKLPTAVK